jgi:hypothetical protein
MPLGVMLRNIKMKKKYFIVSLGFLLKNVINKKSMGVIFKIPANQS